MNPAILLLLLNSFHNNDDEDGCSFGDVSIEPPPTIAMIFCILGIICIFSGMFLPFSIFPYVFLSGMGLTLASCIIWICS